MQMMSINRSNTVTQVNVRVDRIGNQKTAQFMSKARQTTDVRRLGTSEFQQGLKRVNNIGAQKVAATMQQVKSDTDTAKIGTGRFQQGLDKINATGAQKIAEAMQNVSAVFSRAATSYQSGAGGPIGNMIDLMA